MAKKKRNFLKDFEKHLDLSDRAYIHAHKADKLYKSGKIKEAEVELAKAERYMDRAKNTCRELKVWSRSRERAV